MERLWLSLINSGGFRRLMKQGPGAALLRSRAYGQLNLARRYATTLVRSRRQPGLFDSVEIFCLFVGHMKSGGTLLGSLLDAHPHAILADEALAVQYVSRGFQRDQVYHLLLKASRRAVMKGRVTARRLGGYSFELPGLWQGRYTTLRVVGDSTAGATTRRLDAEPELLARLQRVLGDSVRLLHVIRNPYDPISVMTVRGKRSLPDAIDDYFASCAMLEGISARAREAGVPLHRVRYEDVVRETEAQLAAVCGFLRLPLVEGYVEACAALIHDTPDRFRERVSWPPALIDAVAARAAQFDFLAGYTFEN